MITVHLCRLSKWILFSQICQPFDTIICMFNVYPQYRTLVGISGSTTSFHLMLWRFSAHTVSNDISNVKCFCCCLLLMMQITAICIVLIDSLHMQIQTSKHMKAQCRWPSHIAACPCLCVAIRCRAQNNLAEWARADFSYATCYSCTFSRSLAECHFCAAFCGFDVKANETTMDSFGCLCAPMLFGVRS